MAIKELHTRAETAKLFSVTVRTLDNWSHRGILKRTKIGGKVYYRDEDLKELLTSNTSSDE